jgi:hypothetical protein
MWRAPAEHPPHTQEMTSMANKRGGRAGSITPAARLSNASITFTNLLPWFGPGGPSTRRKRFMVSRSSAAALGPRYPSRAALRPGSSTSVPGTISGGAERTSDGGTSIIKRERERASTRSAHVLGLGATSSSGEMAACPEAGDPKNPFSTSPQPIRGEYQTIRQKSKPFMPPRFWPRPWRGWRAWPPPCRRARAPPPPSRGSSGRSRG